MEGLAAKLPEKKTNPEAEKLARDRAEFDQQRQQAFLSDLETNITRISHQPIRSSMAVVEIM
jgi:hypothetical protein